jgi:hypothetical protein
MNKQKIKTAEGRAERANFHPIMKPNGGGKVLCMENQEKIKKKGRYWGGKSSI